VIDVDANMGQFATELRNSGYAGRIISFEPVMACYQHLLTIADNQWQVENYALGDTNATENIHISITSDLSSILPANDYETSYYSEKIDAVDTQSIQIKKLDDIISALVNNVEKRTIFLKIDTQGYDDRVMLGAANTLKHVIGSQTEVSCKAIYQDTPPVHETLKHLADSGFTIAGIFPISHDKNTLRMIEFDCVLIREASHK